MGIDQLNRGVILLPWFPPSSTLLNSSSPSSSTSSPHSYIDPTRRSWSSKYLCKSPFSSSPHPQHPSSHLLSRSSSADPRKSFCQERRRRQRSTTQRKGKAAKRRQRMRGEKRRRRRKRIRRLRSQEEVAATAVTMNGGTIEAAARRWRCGSWWYGGRDGTASFLGFGKGTGLVLPPHGWVVLLCMTWGSMWRWLYVLVFSVQSS